MTEDRLVPSPAEPPRTARPLASWDPPPRILISNDDGVESPGLAALRTALERVGDVWVMAPEVNQSAVGHAKTFRRSLRIRERRMADGRMGSAVDGSPSDAVAVAVEGYFGVSFDLVASGINEGANLAEDVTYSGTVGAAMEAALLGVPALAMSLGWDPDPDHELAMTIAERSARNILEHGLGERELLNINVPSVPPAGCEGIEITRMGRRVYTEVLLERSDPRGLPYYWFGGSPPSGDAEPGTDVAAVMANRVSITPIHLDLTDIEEMDRIRSWRWTADGATADMTSPLRPVVSATDAEPTT